ncbi:MAG: 1-(5-phosphoribosyl)-5-[(5-phosphoribosylamino)methylideneamino]imidazole-4-carboxamide isomerase [Kiritimatiellae bacterium]|nr:1-(5-phosphoribosyl)-5-[(5-phosphoribosylamino)methylideneamino]imidazole-4-carboxamide isomerase [Kiritimatiellia bacterium]
MSFLILPAIDLRGGRCVRLRQGRADDQTVYSDDPADMADRWRDEGAEYLHVVDLDGAFAGRPMQLDEVRRIVAQFGRPVELGGGIRTDADIRAALDTGVQRVILGTRACASPDEIVRLVGEYGPRIAVGIDARDGIVKVAGWMASGQVALADLARRMSDAGVSTLIVTDIARDGMLSGPNVASLSDTASAVRSAVIASGGVSAPDDIRALRACGRDNLNAAIVGKALYDGATTLAALHDAAREPL